MMRASITSARRMTARRDCRFAVSPTTFSRISQLSTSLKDPNEIYDLSETLLGLDEGGSATPPGANAPIALPGTQAAARRRARRLKYAYVFLYQHNTDLSLRKMLMDEAHNDGEAAWTIMLRECDVPITELELEDLKRNVRCHCKIHIWTHPTQED